MQRPCCRLLLPRAWRQSLQPPRHRPIPLRCRDAVTLAGVRAHQAQFQSFADLSGGTREASTLGYQLSADYVAGLMDGGGIRP